MGNGACEACLKYVSREPIIYTIDVATHSKGAVCAKLLNTKYISMKQFKMFQILTAIMLYPKVSARLGPTHKKKTLALSTG